MQRVLALMTLVVWACLVAGCGGSALQAKARKVVGDPHATVVSTETISTQNMTGLLSMCRGLGLRNDSQIAGPKILGSVIVDTGARFRIVCRPNGAGVFASMTSRPQ